VVRARLMRNTVHLMRDTVHLMRDTVHLLTAEDTDAIAAEGARLLGFAAPADTWPASGGDVRFAPVS